LELVRSPAHWLENEANPREDRRLAAATWLNGASVRVEMTTEVEARARELAALDFRVLDALHVAFAELAGVRWFVTCDDRLLKAGSRHRDALRVAFANPCDLLSEAET
jgi:predicted nucleic acid-binding protein